ncbi:MAG: DUF3168 domain-containing protein [Sedimentisphaerales bacterium]|nr:DUF3168 domain-containing protein [Sedimentisphaerales bacterium]
MIEKALHYILVNNSAVTALVGSGIYPNKIPQGAAVPAITYQQISGVRFHDMLEAAGMVKARYQFNCWAAGYAKTREIAEAVRLALDNYSGTASQTVIDVIHLDNEGDMPEMTAGADELGRYGKYLDFIVWFKEPVT